MMSVGLIKEARRLFEAGTPNPFPVLTHRCNKACPVHLPDVSLLMIESICPAQKCTVGHQFALRRFLRFAGCDILWTTPPSYQSPWYTTHSLVITEYAPSGDIASPSQVETLKATRLLVYRSGKNVFHNIAIIFAQHLSFVVVVTGENRWIRFSQ